MPDPTVSFLSSYTRVEDTPSDSIPVYAFTGRSNVGKSSLINLLSNHKSLAKVSKQPGKTQLINYFKMDDLAYLVDLPGYGFARQSKTKRKAWAKMMEIYLRQKNELMCIFVLLDSTIPIQPADQVFFQFVGQEQLPFAVIFTKVDRISKSRRVRTLKQRQKELLEYWEVLPPAFEVSSVSGEGKTEVLQYISDISGAVR